MEKKHSSYETVFIVDTSLGDEAVAELSQQVHFSYR